MEEVEIFVEAGAPKLTMDSTNYLGQTVIHLAAENPDSGILSILISYFDNLNIQVHFQGRSWEDRNMLQRHFSFPLFLGQKSLNSVALCCKGWPWRECCYSFTSRGGS